ncbi:RNase adapter RapZ [Nosocomiicoccus ampullae]|uniref:UPF0042 nucleotide-binding protein n=1 Tax=Nosocomiicoccus ampullae TaxID=489910 RepID=A0A9Q2CZK9_9STAP|nr:RNase adapter RapZ [Nosocomiicoccus ampullae]MBB5175739.1 UPF0042 nucleotide-binding protein [Nosocomiicoccus ampullae]QYA47128.1 RNase adapter RapZ [Nosocomiicoccus ampullae]
MKNLVILTGMSGAGKSVALESLEDMGYFSIDNLPVPLLPKIVEMMQSTNEHMHDVALSIDLRDRKFFSQLVPVINELITEKEMRTSIVFLDASDSKLISRYKETRRSHPLNDNVTLSEAIQNERQLLKDVKKVSSYIIDTTDLSTKKLKENISNYLNYDRNEGFTVNVLSFGFKHEIPKDADIMFDVRFLPNPFYVEELRPKTGLDEDVYNYIMQFKDTDIFYNKFVELLNFTLPLYVKEGKTQLNIAIGCTGGQHRSVALAERISNYLRTRHTYRVNTIHKEVHRALDDE